MVETIVIVTHSMSPTHVTYPCHLPMSPTHVTHPCHPIMVNMIVITKVMVNTTIVIPMSPTQVTHSCHPPMSPTHVTQSW